MKALDPPIWLTTAQVRMLHSESTRLFGGAIGVRDETLLESALDRPRNKWHYEPSTTVFELAAASGYGIAKNHAFIDGNKRSALLAMRAFLFVNGYRLQPDEVDTVTVIEGLAAGSVDEKALADWAREKSQPRA